MRPTGDWFTEEYRDDGAALSLAVGEKLHEVRTAYQLIEVYRTQAFGNLLVIDGCVMLTSRDNFIYHEMMAHPALYTHPDPRRVVIIGGGDCGTLREVLKHPGVEQVVQVDIDEQVTRAAEVYFPELCESNDDPRADLRFEDGIAWMQNCAAGSVDVIIVDSTDPVGPAEGLFREPFYRDCLKALGAGGLAVQQSESPLLHTNSIILPLHRAVRSAGFTDAVTLHFPLFTYPSGWWTATIAAKSTDPRSFRGADSAGKAFSTGYYNADIHRAALAQPEFLSAPLASLD